MWAVSLVIAYSHLMCPRGLGMYGLTYPHKPLEADKSDCNHQADSPPGNLHLEV